MSIPTIKIPYPAGGSVVLKISDADTPVRVWLELCRDPTSRRWTFPAVLVDAVEKIWVANIPASFVSNWYGQEWQGIVFIQTATIPEDALAVLPMLFTIDNEYEPTQQVIVRGQVPDVLLNINRIVAADLNIPDFLFIYNHAKQE